MTKEKTIIILNKKIKIKITTLSKKKNVVSHISTSSKADDKSLQLFIYILLQIVNVYQTTKNSQVTSKFNVT